MRPARNAKDEVDSDEDDRASLASIRSTISLAPEAFQRMGTANRFPGPMGGAGGVGGGRRSSQGAR